MTVFASVLGLAPFVSSVAVASSPVGPEGPRLDVPAAVLAASLRCSPGLAHARTNPVLLTPAFSSAATSYGWNYQPQLAADGIPACAISVPDDGYGDLQRTAEHVVYAVRRMHAESGRQIVLLGHQHGALDELWALTFWPDVARSVSNLVSLETPFEGTTSSQGLCSGAGHCTAALRQITKGSRFLAALHAAPLPRGVSITSIASNDDTLITPQPAASHLPGARNLVLQNICPGRYVDHFGSLADSVAYDLFRDAATHSGPADPHRLPAGACDTRFMPAADPTVLNFTSVFLSGFFARNAASDDTEPPIRTYALRRPPLIALRTRRARVGAHGSVTLRIWCQTIGDTACQLVISGTDSGGQPIAGTRLVLRSGNTGTATVRINHRRERASEQITLNVRAADALGNHGSKRATVRLV